MYVALIPPIPLLERYGKLTAYHLCLAHLMHNLEYADFYRARANAGDFIIMDNSVIELGKPVALEQLVAAATSIGAKEIVLPDQLQDIAGTLKIVNDALQHWKLKEWQQNTGGSIMVVPQGRSLYEFQSCFAQFVEMPNWTTLGVPRSLNQMKDDHKHNRISFLNWLQGQFTPEKPWFAVHLLGLSDNVTELLSCREFPWIRGVDTKLPIRAGIHYVGFDKDKGLLISKNSLPKLDLLQASYDPQPAITLHNIRVTFDMAQAISSRDAEIIQWPVPLK